jgi:cell division protein FtsQ
MKRFLIALAALAVIGYLFFSANHFRESSKSRLCERFEVVVKDSVRTAFVRAQEIEALVKRHGLYPVGKPFSEVNTLAIRDTIMSNRLVESVEVYTTSNGSVVASIRQREPVLRVISDIKGSFYVDDDRQIMPVSPAFTVYVPLATGAIGEEMAKNELYDFAMFLHRNAHWNAWIEHIAVRGNGDVVLIPRAGDFQVVMGSLHDYPAKLAKLARFVDEGLNVVGWNRYTEINLKYDNQVVCTKK